MTSEVDLTRALHTVVVTLNDQKLSEFDADRVQEIATGACGGELKLVAYGSGTSGELRDGSVEGETVARFPLDRGGWSVGRVPEKRGEGPGDNPPPYQNPAKLRAEVWKKKLPGGG